MNTVVVAFDDGFRVATSRWYIRREVRATTAASKGRHAAAARRVRQPRTFFRQPERMDREVSGPADR